MKLDDVSDLLGYISDTVPAGSYGPRALEGFYDGLKDLPTPLVVDAVKVLVRRKAFKPVVAEIRDEVFQMLGIGDGDDEWLAVLGIVKGGPPYPIEPLENPIAAKALESIGGLPRIRLTERPDLVRKEFMEAYGQLRSREIGTPKVTLPVLESSRDAAGELAGTSRAIEAGDIPDTTGRRRIDKPDPEGHRYE